MSLKQGVGLLLVLMPVGAMVWLFSAVIGWKVALLVTGASALGALLIGLGTTLLAEDR